MRTLSFALTLLLTAGAASAQLGPEQAVTSEPAQFPVTIRAAGHQLTAWVHPSTFEMRAKLDGAVLSVGQSDDFATAPVVAANDTSFLIVWVNARQNTLFGRRIAFDGSLLDAAPIAIGAASYYTTNESIAIVTDGPDSIVWWSTEQAVRVARIAGATSTPVAERPWLGGFGTPQIRALGTRVFYGDDQPVPGIICDPVSCWNGFFGTFAPNGAGSIDASQLLGDQYQAGPIAVVSDGVRYTLLWWGTQRGVWTQALFAAQLSPALDLLAGPKVIYERTLADSEYPPPALRAVWNGSEIVVASNSRTTLRAFRLTRYADAIDRQPFDIAAVPIWNSTPSVIPIESGVLFTYAVEDDRGVRHAFTRTLDRAEGLPRGRAVRH